MMKLKNKLFVGALAVAMLAPVAVVSACTFTSIFYINGNRVGVTAQATNFPGWVTTSTSARDNNRSAAHSHRGNRSTSVVTSEIIRGAGTLHRVAGFRQG